MTPAHRCTLRRLLKEEAKTWAIVALIIAAYGGLRYFI